MQYGLPGGKGIRWRNALFVALGQPRGRIRHGEPGSSKGGRGRSEHLAAELREEAEGRRNMRMMVQ